MHTLTVVHRSVDHSCEVPLTDIGYAYGYLLADEIAENYQSLLKSLLGDKWYDEVSEVSRSSLLSIKNNCKM